MKYSLDVKTEDRMTINIWSDTNEFQGQGAIYVDFKDGTTNGIYENLFLDLCGVPKNLSYKERVCYYHLLVPRVIYGKADQQPSHTIPLTERLMNDNSSINL